MKSRTKSLTASAVLLTLTAGFTALTVLALINSVCPATRNLVAG